VTPGCSSGGRKRNGHGNGKMYYVYIRKTNSKPITRRSLTFPERTTRNYQQSVNREVCFLVMGRRGTHPGTNQQRMLRTTKFQCLSLDWSGIFGGAGDDRMKGRQRSKK
jgi:hypothetical protein